MMPPDGDLGRRFTYPETAIRPRIGDRVRFLDDSDILTVEDVIDCVEKKNDWGLDEMGVMLKGGIYGLVFTKVTDVELEFISRDDGSKS